MWIFNFLNRSNVPAQPALADRILEALALLLLVCIWGMTVYFWNVLPEEIPVHFDLDGTANGYGVKSALFLIAGMGTFAMLIVAIGAYNPKMINIPVKANSPRQYFLMFRMVRVVNVIIALLFICIILNMASPGLEIHSKLLACSDLFLGALIIGVIIYYCYLIYRAGD